MDLVWKRISTATEYKKEKKVRKVLAREPMAMPAHITIPKIGKKKSGKKYAATNT